MTPIGLYELIDAIWRHDQWVGFLVGTAAGGLIGLLAFKYLLPTYLKAKLEGARARLDALREDIQALEQRGDQLQLEKSHLQERLDEANKHRESLQQLCGTQEAQVRAGAGDLKKLSTERNRLLNELTSEKVGRSLAEADLVEAREELAVSSAEFSDRIGHGVRQRWDQPVGDGAARFEPLHTRQMPIISVINLKGGVGKTTLTANLGATLSRRGYRVLLVDLDYQGSLTSLCLSPQEHQEVQKGHRYVQDILKNGDFDRTREVFRNAVRLEDLDIGPAFLLSANDRLDEVELQVQAHWLMGAAGEDVRFRLRSALHDPAIWAEYDVVLLDCPPRLSAGCVNALAASDYALIPVVPEPMSTEATPRLLSWLKNFQRTCCQQLSVLGVVGNRVRFHQGTTPVKGQSELWTSLKPDCRTAWGSDVRFFDKAMIRQFPTLSHRLAALTPEGKPVMEDLVHFLSQDIPPYARLRSAAVHPVAHPAPAGVRG